MIEELSNFKLHTFHDGDTLQWFLPPKIKKNLEEEDPQSSPFFNFPPLKRPLQSPSSPHIVYPFIDGSMFTLHVKRPYEIKFKMRASSTSLQNVPQKNCQETKSLHPEARITNSTAKITA